MITVQDGAVIASLITTTAAAIVSVVVAIRQTGTNARIDRVHEQVQTSNGRTIGDIIEANDLTGGDGGH